ncbi:MAG: MaoC family dehydratase [Pseudorhodoplanes sp.]|nr:MAG: MaoC family dehydratase [Pseudorhodoplanes sp.]MBZ0141808.1 MaoC family dehydratase [Pseudorhodoplanes sp.]
MRVMTGERFSEVIRMTPGEAVAFARAAHDFNPLHHDAEFAARSRYKKLIASGTQMAARLMALAATHYSARYDAVGLDFSIRFHKAIYGDETVTLEWEVMRVTQTSAQTGDVVELKGRVLNENGELAVTATGRLMVTDKS